MKQYRALVSGGSQLAESPLILEQQRACLSAQFVHSAVQWAFYYAAEDGVDAERNPYQVELWVNDQHIATITLDVWQELSRVYAQVRIARRDGKSMVLRTMTIQD